MQHWFWGVAAVVLAHANKAFPDAKSMFPRSLHRWVLVKVLRTPDAYHDMMRTNPERLYLDHEVMPWVARNWRRVLFVGTAPYTFHYETLFADDPDRYHTIDHGSFAHVWGSKHHMVASVLDIHRHRPDAFFDCVVMNGVIAYKLPDLDDYGIQECEFAALAAALHKVMKPGGLLVVGWDGRDRVESPFAQFEAHFERASTPWGSRKEFTGDPHVVEFYKRRS